MTQQTRTGRRTAERREAGRCVRCGVPAAGRLCPDHRRAEREYVAGVRAVRLSLGLCVVHNCTGRAAGRLCDLHRGLERLACRARRARIKREEAGS